MSYLLHLVSSLLLYMSSIMFTLLLLSLLQTTTSTVYIVTPDDPNTTCHHCHNLQHYLLNTTKYFTSNTQLLFLPGLYHLHTDLIIQNVHNISLVGNTTQDVVIQCVSETAGVLMINITNLAISNMIIKNCQVTANSRRYKYLLIEMTTTVALIIKDCYFSSVSGIRVLNNISMDAKRNFYFRNTILGVNILGNSYFNNVKCDQMKLEYMETKKSVHKYNIITISSVHSPCLLQFNVISHSYKIVLKLSNVVTTDYIFEGKDIGNSYVIIKNSIFTTFNDHYPFIFYFNSSRNGTVHFHSCQLESQNTYHSAIITALSKINIKIMHCSFNIHSPMLSVNGKYDGLMHSKVKIQNSIISCKSSKFFHDIIKVSNTKFC